MRGAGKTRCGFTLVELAVVVMILGILAAIAAPRFFGASKQATDGTARQSLSVIRAAIDQYAAEHDGAVPGADGSAATFASDLSAYLRGQGFPTCPVGEAKNNAVRIVTGSGTMTVGGGPSSANFSWAYQPETGEFRINSDDATADGLQTYDKY